MVEYTTTATIEDVWRQRGAWAQTARAGKKAQAKARVVALSLGVLGALLGTSVVVLPDGHPRMGMALASLGTVSLVLSGYFGRELLSPERESRWARARILAEALQREFWRSLMRVPPYDSPRLHETLIERVSLLLSNTGLERESAIEGSSKPPDVSTIEGYVEKRAEGQVQWYEGRALEHARSLRLFRRATVVIGAGAAVLCALGASAERVLVFVPVVTTATAALVAWMQAERLASMVSLYQEAATQLRLQVAAWKDSGAERSGFAPEARQRAEAMLVERCEEIMARENDAWRAEWLSEEKAKAALEGLERVQVAARNAGQPQGPTKEGP
jgi:conflict system pore-forming effector with SLATT domain/uncharacterized protein DUF4231